MPHDEKQISDAPKNKNVAHFPRQMGFLSCRPRFFLLPGSLCHVQRRQFFLQTLHYLRVGFWFDFAWLGARRVVRLVGATLLALGSVLCACWVEGAALLALEVRHAVGTKRIARIAQGILSLLGTDDWCQYKKS